MQCMVDAALEQKLEAAGSEAEALDKEANRKAPGAGKLKSAIAERERKMATLQKRINEIEDKIFATFSEKASFCEPEACHAMLPNYHTDRRTTPSVTVIIVMDLSLCSDDVGHHGSSVIAKA